MEACQNGFQSCTLPSPLQCFGMRLGPHGHFKRLRQAWEQAWPNWQVGRAFEEDQWGGDPYEAPKPGHPWPHEVCLWIFQRQIFTPSLCRSDGNWLSPLEEGTSRGPLLLWLCHSDASDVPTPTDSLWVREETNSHLHRWLLGSWICRDRCSYFGLGHWRKNCLQWSGAQYFDRDLEEVGGRLRTLPNRTLCDGAVTLAVQSTVHPPANNMVGRQWLSPLLDDKGAQS